MNDIPPRPFRAPTQASSLIIQGLIFGGCIALAYLIGEARGWAIGTGVGAIAILLEFCWPLRKQPWFWCLLATFAAIHAVALLWLDWNWIAVHRDGLKELGALLMLDLAAMTAVVYGLYCVIYGKPAEAWEPSVDDLPRYNDSDISV